MSFRIGKKKPEVPKVVKIEEKKEKDKDKEDPFKNLEKTFEKIGILVLLESKMKMSKFKIVILLGISCLYSFLTLMNFYGDYLSNLLAFIYPSYQSMKAMEEGEKGNYKHWLSFW